MTTRIKDALRNIKYGLQNFWKYKTLIWRDRDWDWAYLYQIMEFKLQEMAKLHREYGICTNNIGLAEEMEEAAGCLNRIYEDMYELDDYLKSRDMSEADLERFCKLFKENSKGWWD